MMPSNMNSNKQHSRSSNAINEHLAKPIDLNPRSPTMFTDDQRRSLGSTSNSSPSSLSTASHVASPHTALTSTDESGNSTTIRRPSVLFATSPNGSTPPSSIAHRGRQNSQTFHFHELLHLKDDGHNSEEEESQSPVVGASFRKRTRKKLVIAMVGLPARGKTYIGKKLSRWLNWTGYKSQVFNIGSYRRRLIGYFGGHTAAFFDPLNDEGAQQRTECAIHALEDMFTFFDKGGHCGVYDGTNSTAERRQLVIDRCKSAGKALGMEIELVWIESVCNDEAVIEANIRETKLTSPDYANVQSDEAVKDFRQRIANYERFYEPIPNESDQSYVKIIDAGRQVVTNRIQGYLMSKLVSFLLNIRINHAPIYLTRHGESQHNTKGWIGGDSHLTERGLAYAQALSKFIYSQDELQDESKPNKLNVNVWSSTLRRTIETASALKIPFVQWQALKEIQVGICDSMSYEDIEEKYPEEFEARKKDKLHYRYPQGESYMDVVQRLEPVIMELERIAAPVLVVCHRAVARCLYSYFLDEPPETIPHLDVPLHSVYKLQPKAYGCQVTRHQLGVPSVESAALV